MAGGFGGLYLGFGLDFTLGLFAALAFTFAFLLGLVPARMTA